MFYCVIFGFIGLVLGVLVNDMPYLTLNREISVLDIVGIIVGLLVAFIPFKIEKLIKSQNQIKDLLKNDLNKLLDIANEIESIIERASTQQDNKNQLKNLIMYQLNKGELIITHFIKAFAEELSLIHI